MGTEHELLFPRQDGESGGWTIDFAFLEDVAELVVEYEDVSLESIEAILLAAEKAREQ